LAVESSSGNYRATKNCEYVSSSKDVVAAMTSGRAQIADARSLGRFRGELPEPREGLRGGAIPGSLCIPFTAIVDPDNYTKFKSLHEMNRVFKDSGLVYGTKVILTCGSGVTASILHFGLHLMGMELQSIPVYDGSWTEWGDPARTDLPVMGPQ
jgi:thiosulfate/3-mercaptopyruvate sulfurtransferase